MFTVLRNSPFAKTLLGSAFFIFLLASCDGTEVEAQPEIPPASSFEMDYEDFPDGGNVLARTETRFNFGVSALTVGIWRTFTGLTMALPVAAFKAALDQEPTYDEARDAWHWTFTVGDPNNTNTQFTCDLYGSVENEQVNWEMYLTNTGVFEDFLWYTGVSQFDRTRGEWTVYRDPEGNSRAFLQIDWERDTTAGTAMIRYEDIDAQSTGNGSYIEAGREDGSTYDRYFTISNVNNGNLSEIEWNATTREGHYRVNNGAWNCWNSNLDDIVCTE